MACARLCWLYSVALHVLGMAFSCTELERSLAFVTAKSENTEKYYLSPSKETNEERIVKRWVSKYLLSYEGKGVIFL